MGSSINSCFEEPEEKGKVHQVSPISSLCQNSAEKPDVKHESPKYESPVKQVNGEIFVEEVKQDTSNWILTEDNKDEGIASP